MYLLDVKTIMISFTILHVFSVGILLLFRKSYPESMKGINHWVFSFSLHILGICLLAFSDRINPNVAIISGNVVLIFATVLILRGLGSFLEKKVSLLSNVLELSAFGILHTYFTVFEPSLTFRIVNFSFFYALIFLHCLYVIWFVPPRSTKSDVYYLWVYILGIALVSILRGIMIYAYPPGGDSILSIYSAMDSYFLIALQSLAMGMVFYMIMLMNRRLTQELEGSILEAKELAHAASQANQIKTDFLANVSHELRTPLHCIIGINSLLMSTDLDPEQKEYAQTISVTSKELHHLIDDILDFSKMSSGSLDMEFQPFLLGTLWQNLEAEYSAEARRKNIVFMLESSCHPELELHGDSRRLYQVFSHLTDNAIKFTEQGSVTVSVQCMDETSGRTRLRFTVEDTGVGIADEMKNHIFKQFVQADNSFTRRHGGMGIGLAISKEIVALMGGQIGFESKFGVGSKFWFQLDLPKVLRSETLQRLS